MPKSKGQSRSRPIPQYRVRASGPTGPDSSIELRGGQGTNVRNQLGRKREAGNFPSPSAYRPAIRGRPGRQSERLRSIYFDALNRRDYEGHRYQNEQNARYEAMKNLKIDDEMMTEQSRAVNRRTRRRLEKEAELSRRAMQDGPLPKFAQSTAGIDAFEGRVLDLKRQEDAVELARAQPGKRAALTGSAMKLGMSLGSGLRQISTPPTAVGLGTTNRLPRIYRVQQGITVEHTEFMGTFSGYADFSAVGLGQDARRSEPIVPMNSSMFPWLAQIAGGYEFYEFESLEFLSEPSVGTAVKGVNMMLIQYDADDIPPNTQDAFYNTAGATRANAWMPNCIHYSRTAGNQVGKRMISRGFNLDINGNTRLPESNPNDDPRLERAGIFSFASVGYDTISPAIVPRVGELWVRYKVRLTVPQTGDDYIRYASVGQSLTGVSVSYPIGTDKLEWIQTPGSLSLTNAYEWLLGDPGATPPIPPYATGHYGYFFSSPGTYIINMVQHGTGLTSPTWTDPGTNRPLNAGANTFFNICGPSISAALTTSCWTFIVSINDTSVPLIIAQFGATSYTAIDMYVAPIPRRLAPT